MKESGEVVSKDKESYGSQYQKSNGCHPFLECGGEGYAEHLEERFHQNHKDQAAVEYRDRE